ncbi:MAG TPA: tripartite tricarboxylate transporter substrate-binding protein, partial [Bacillales bacterium]
VLKQQKLVEKPISVINKPGGSGEVGWKYLEKQDGHTLAINSSLVITNHLLGHSELTYKQFTPIAILTTEWMALVVPANSKFESGKALLEQLKKDPKSVKIAIAPGLGNDAHLSFVEACNTFGVDVSKVNFLIYGSGGDQVQALVGNHVDAAMMSVSEIKQQYKAGKVDILAVTSGERLSDLKDVPTWKEQGIDLVFPHWRGVMGPPDMSQAAIDFWDKKIGKMVETDAWKEVLANNQWESFYKDSSETKKFLKAQVEKYKELVESAGLVK